MVAFKLEKDKKVVFIVGMHRSGTSVLARGLKSIGVNLGRNLSGPATDNEKGFWEDRDVVAINESILGTFGQRWDSVSLVPEDISNFPLFEYKDRALSLVKGAISKSKCFGMKDPRLSLLLPFWISVVKEAGLDYVCIFSLRSPVAIAKSLAVRNRMNEEKASLLIIKYWLRILQTVAVKRLAFVDYDELLESPNHCLSFILNFLSIEGSPEIESDIEEYISDFLSLDLRHEVPSVVEEQRWIDRGTPFSISMGLYECLKKYSCRKQQLTKKSWFQYVSAFEAMSPIFPYIDTLESQSITNQAVEPTEQQRSTADQLTQVVEEQKQELARLGGVVEQSSEQLQALSSKNSELVEQVAEAEQRAIQAQAKEAEIAVMAEQHRSTAELLTQVVDEQKQELARLGGVVEQSSEQLQALSSKNSELVEQVAEAEQRATLAQAKETEIAATAEQHRSAVDQLTQVVDEQKQELARLGGVVEQSSEQLQALSSKNSELLKQVFDSEQRVTQHQAKEIEMAEQLRNSSKRIEELMENVELLENRERELTLLSEEWGKERERLVGELNKRISIDDEQVLREELEQRQVIEEKLQCELSSLRKTCNDLEASVEKIKLKESNIAQKLEQSLQHQSALVAYQENLKHIIERERYTVVRPVIRTIYKVGKSCVNTLPLFLRHPLRKLGHAFFSQSVVANELDTIAPSIHHFASQESNSAEISDELVKYIEDEVLNCGASGYDVVVFPVIDWHFRIQRPQHLARYLAKKGRRVYYFSTTFHNGLPGVDIIEKIEDRIFICQLNLPAPHPVIYEQIASKVQIKALVSGLNNFLDAVGSKQVVSIVDHPFWRSIAMSVQGGMLVYDCMDDHGGFSNNATEILCEEDKLLQDADIVVTTSAPLSEKIGEKRDNVLVRNAGESQWFSEAPDKLAYKSDRPVIGYYGAISEWFDIALVIKAAKSYPEYDFVLVGSTFMCDTKKAEKLKNIHFVGEVPYQSLKEYLYAFDVCMIPFKLIELIQCTNPVKMYEYLASGKPVVATNMPEVRAVEEHIFVAESEKDFVHKIQLALNEKDVEEKVESRKQFALQNQWQNRVDSLDKAIQKSYPKVSVVVLTYNNLDFTKACLHSLEQYTNYPNWELIIVDNASSDGTPDYLQKYVEGKVNTKLLLNDENLGFSAGNNVGIRVAEGEYVVALNNDTYVTKGWVWDLVRHFNQDKELGLIGPVTNNIGNEAKIEINYADMEEMARYSRAYTQAHVGERLYVNTVAFFCVAIKKEIIEEVGLLDEAFGRGFFEDDDYCIRVRNAGYKVAVADDVFIHHHLSASFNKLKDTEKQKLFEANKAIFEAKWGEWVPHRYRDEV